MNAWPAITATHLGVRLAFLAFSEGPVGLARVLSARIAVPAVLALAGVGASRSRHAVRALVDTLRIAKAGVAVRVLLAVFLFLVLFLRTEYGVARVPLSEHSVFEVERRRGHCLHCDSKKDERLDRDARHQY